MEKRANCRLGFFYGVSHYLLSSMQPTMALLEVAYLEISVLIQTWGEGGLSMAEPHLLPYEGNTLLCIPLPPVTVLTHPREKLNIQH